MIKGGAACSDGLEAISKPMAKCIALIFSLIISPPGSQTSFVVIVFPKNLTGFFINEPGAQRVS
jgi:hypothetical protein